MNCIISFCLNTFSKKKKILNYFFCLTFIVEAQTGSDEVRHGGLDGCSPGTGGSAGRSDESLLFFSKQRQQPAKVFQLTREANMTSSR